MHEASIQLLEGKEVPSRFKRIAPLHLVAAAVGRKVCLKTRYGKLFPAPITGLVGSPGTGKTQVISPIEEIIRELAAQDKLYVAPRNMTKASLIDHLQKAERTFSTIQKLPGDPTPLEKKIAHTFHHVSIFASEFGVMTGKYDPEMLQTLSVFYDCEKLFDESKRKFKDEEEHTKVITNPTVPMIFGTQQRYMTEFMPVTSWEQGFATRVWFVYSSEGVERKKGLFDFDEEENDELRHEIVREVERLSMIEGVMKIEKKAANFLNDFYLEGDAKSAPNHSLLSAGWNSRRCPRLQMYTMMYALCKREELLITIEDCEEVLAWMLEDEKHLVRMMEDTGSSADGEVMRSVWEFIRRRFVEGKVGTSRTDVKVYIANRGDVNKADKYIKELEEMGAIKITYGKIGNIEDKTKSMYFPQESFSWT